MTSALLTELLRGLAVLSMFLLIGMFIRAKVKLFQKVFLPASVIGGFLLLLLGPRIWGDNSPIGTFLGVTEDWVNTWSLLPGLLIVPIFAAIPLGMFSNKKEDKDNKMSKKSKIGFVLVSAGLFSAITSIQTVLGFGTNVLYSKFRPGELYRTFGFELNMGFIGGHGSAGAVGKMLEGFGIDYWEVAQGVTTTVATIGLIGGMMIGIILINIAARKRRTAVLENPEDVPMELKRGYTDDITRQASMGRETTYSSSIETISVHLAIILVGVGLGYYLRNILIGTGIQAFTSLPVWFYGLFMMFILDFAIAKIGLGWMIDSKVKSRIVGSISDFAIIAAIASVPVQAVMEYIVPIIILSILGFIGSYLFIFVLYGKFYGDNAPFEHAIIAWGTATGVMINGLMLLKICDPDYETPALMNFTMGFSITGMLGLVKALFTMQILATGSTMDNLLVGAVMLIFDLALAIIGRRLITKNSPIMS